MNSFDARPNSHVGADDELFIIYILWPNDTDGPKSERS